MDQADQINLIRHRRQLATDSLPGEKFVVKHGAEDEPGARFSTMYFLQWMVTSALTGCLIAGDRPIQFFASCTEGLQQMVTWLKKCGITSVALRSTGVYWIALYDILQEADFEVYLVNARYTKSLSGRKSDVKESQ